MQAIFNEILQRLEGVKFIDPHRVKARCPAHQDRSPSLSIREGNRGILIHCFAGCSIQNICEAIGIHIRDLFFDSTPQDKKARLLQKKQKKFQQQKNYVKGLQIDALREADRFLEATRGIDINTLTESEFDALMNVVATAQTHLLAERDLMLWT